MKRVLIVVCVFALGCTHLSSGNEAAEEPSELASFDDGSETNELEPVEENQASEETLDVEQAEPQVAEVPPEEQGPPPAEVIATEEIKTSEAEAITEIPQAEEVVTSEPETPVPAAVETVSLPPPPSLVVTGKFARIRQECEVRSNPSDEADRLRTLHTGLKVWTEPADGPWKKVFLKGQESFVSTNCFLTVAKVEEPKIETPPPAPAVTAQVKAPKEEVAEQAAPASVTTTTTVTSEVPPPPPPPVRADPPALAQQPDLNPSNPGFLVGLGAGVVICAALMLVRRMGSRNSRSTGFGEQTSTMI